MEVKVRDALADLVVHRQEAPLRPKRLLHGLGEQPGVSEERIDQMLGEVGERLVMLAWNEKDMAGKERAIVEERDAAIVLHHDLGASVAVGDGTKGAHEPGD